ncbi:MAG: T9SS type A sorting domain-containing protein [Spirochaetales bacterium]|nr:T9SS type A sorting domain-containing protein [Spirochaetales bacterium]
MMMKAFVFSALIVVVICSSAPAVNAQTGLDLTTWDLVALDLPGGESGYAVWDFTADGTRASTLDNRESSFLLAPVPQDKFTLNVSCGVTGTDDDLIGLVFSYDDAAHCYIFDWKSSAQDDSPEGFIIRHVAAPSVESLSPDDLYPGVDTAHMTILGQLTGPGRGWVRGHEYNVSLTVRPGSARVVVREGETILWDQVVTDVGIDAGRCGFYVHSQPFAYFSNTSLESPTWPVNPGPSITLRIEESMASMCARAEFTGTPLSKSESNTQSLINVEIEDGFAVVSQADLIEYALIFGDIDRIDLYDAMTPSQRVGHIEFRYTLGDYFDNRKVDAYVFVHNDELPMAPGNPWEYYAEGEFPVSMLVPPNMSALSIGDAAKEPVLFVHGINTQFDDTWQEVPGLVAPNIYDCWRFCYPHDQAIDRSSHLLGLAVERVLTGGIPNHSGYDSDSISIVAHSMGGLVSRSYIQGDDYLQRGAVKKLLMFGTPNHGSHSAYRSAYDPDYLTFSLDVLDKNDPHAPAHKMMVPGSPFLWDLNETPLRDLATGTPARDYLVVAGVEDYHPWIFKHREIYRQDDGFVAAASASLLEHRVPLALTNRHHINMKEQDEDNNAAGIIETFLADSYDPTISTPNFPEGVFCFMENDDNVDCSRQNDVDDQLGILEFRILNNTGVDRYLIELPTDEPGVMDLVAEAGVELGEGNRYLKRVSADGDEYFSMTQRQILEKEIAFWGAEGTYDIRVKHFGTHRGTFENAVDFQWLGTASTTIELDEISCLAISAPNQSRLTAMKAATLNYAFSVDATVDTLVFSLSSSVSSTDFGQHEFSLEDPQGRVIDPVVAAADPAFGYFENTTYGPVQYLITDPVDGTWQIRHDDSVFAPEVYAFLYAGFRTNLSVLGPSHTAGDSLVCQITINGSESCLDLSLELMASLTSPGSTSPVDLGLVTLTNLGGGIFEGVIENTLTGQYRLTLDATCQDQEFGQLTRTAMRDVWFDRAADDVSAVGDMDGDDEVPNEHSLNLSVSPNPFNAATVFRFELGRAQHAELTIYEVNGRKVAVLIDDRLGEGPQSVTWQGVDDQGGAVASGVYLARLQTEDGHWTSKSVLLK